MARPTSIRAQLRLFVAIVLVGAGLGGVVLAWAIARTVNAAERARLTAVADVTVNTAAAAAAETREILEILARRPEIRQLDAERCAPLLTDALGLLPRHLGGAVADTLGEVVCVSRRGVPGPPPPPATERAWFEEVRRRDAFTVGPPVEGMLSGASVVVFAMPVRDDDGATVGYVTLSSPTLERFQELVTRLGDDRTVVTLATDGGRVIARSHDAAAWVGRQLPASDDVPPPDGSRDGVSRAPDADGVSRLWVHREIPDYGWRVFAGVARADVFALAARRIAPPLAVFAVLLVGLAWIMFRVRDSVDRALTRLLESMRRVRRGGGRAVAKGPDPVEVTEVVEQFERTLTELDAALAREREVRARLQSVLKNAVFAIFVCDRRGRLAGCNPAMSRMLGYRDEAQLHALTVADLFMTPHEADQLLTTGVGERGSAEVEWRSATGLPVPVRLNWTVREEGDDGPVVQVIAENLSERRELETQFRQAQKLEAVGRLAGGVAHDFNNRLTVITGQAELLLSELAGDDPKRDYVEGILTSAGRAADLTSQLLAFSRRQPHTPERLDVGAVAREMVPMLGRLLGKGIRLETRWGPVPEVLADAGQVEQILLNLATNARDAVSGRGRIRLTTDAVELDEEAAALRQPEARPGAYAILAVEDDGSGMDPEILDHVFEPFFTTKPAGEGTGLGLATVYGITTQYGGHLRVDSSPGAGTRIEVWLPACGADGSGTAGSSGPEADLPIPSAFAPLPPVTEAAPPTPATGGGAESPERPDDPATVLVVEDEDPVRKLMHRALRRAGYRVLAAPDGATALELLDRHGGRLHVLVTDVRMPGMPGDRVAAAVRARVPGVRVVYMSGDAGSVPDEDAATVLLKPFSPRDLVRRVGLLVAASGTKPAV
jgi:PAS domain S-box-containing protein